MGLEERGQTSAVTEAVIAAEREVLELHARGVPFDTVLDRFVRILEDVFGDGVRISILLLDDEGLHLHHGAAPHLPEAYRRAIEGVAIGEARGSCGTAAHRRDTVIVEDIATHPFWDGWREPALAAGLRACWSTPIYSAGGQVLGTFALYYEEPRAPADEALRLIQMVGRTAAVVIERKRADDERARLLAELRELEARYRNVFEATADALLVIDTSGAYADANPGAAALTGYAVDELRAMRVGELSADPAAAHATWRTVVETGGWQGDAEIVRKDGQIVPVASIVTPVQLPAGPGFVAALRDLSERRALERMKEEFHAMVAHELRNPLAAIAGSAQLMLSTGQLHERALERIVRQTQQLSRLVNDLLDTHQIEAGQLRLQLQREDLASIVRTCADEVARLSPGHRVDVALPDHPVEGTWDADRVSQVLRNLFSNAIKYSPPGSVVNIRAERRDGDVRVSVSDEGPGIAPEALPRLFDRFYRAPSARGSQVRGLGVGLYVSREIAAAHGGKITVQSAVGRGSTFTLTLPVRCELPSIASGSGSVSGTTKSSPPVLTAPRRGMD